MSAAKGCTVIGSAMKMPARFATFANRNDNIAAIGHSMILSARASSSLVDLMPSAVAVLRLITR